MALTPKQERFVQEYMVDLNATAAAERAGYKDPNIGRQLITKNNVAAAIRKAQQKLQKRTEITQDMVIAELAAVAFASGADYKKVVSKDGVVAVGAVPTGSLTRSQLAAVTEIRETQFGVDIKLADKMRALELLGKHLGMFDGKQADGGEGVQIVDDL